MTTGSEDSVAQARAQVYALLAAVFDGDVELLSLAMQTNAFDRLASGIPVSIDVDVLTDSTLDADALGVGYDNLFVVPGSHYVPPFASGHVVAPREVFGSDSVFRDDTARGELLGQPAAMAAGTYERFGFVPTRGSEFPDSLPALLEFVSALATAEVESTDATERTALRALQLSVLEDQLGWIDEFADAVTEADSAEGVFAELAAFTRAFVAYDREGLTEAFADRNTVDTNADEPLSNR